MSTLYRIACAPTQKSYRMGLLFTKGSLISARFLQRSDAAPLRSWKWIVTYRIGLGRFCSHYAELFFMSARKAVRYSVALDSSFSLGNRKIVNFIPNVRTLNIPYLLFGFHPRFWGPISHMERQSIEQSTCSLFCNGLIVK